jgi:hypothetical protein
MGTAATVDANTPFDTAVATPLLTQLHHYHHPRCRPPPLGT